MAIRVPDSATFCLGNVIIAVEDHAGAINDCLQSAFDNSIDGYFDPTYKGTKTCQYNFRNYGPPYCYVSYQDYQNSSSVFDSNARGLWLTETGLVMFILYRDYTIKRYSLSTAWNVSTASYSFSGSLISPYYYSGLYWRYDGMVFYTINSSLTRLERWDVTSPFNPSTGSYNSSWDFSSYDTGMLAIYFNSAGTRMYLVGNQYTYTKLYQFNLSSAWTISSGVSYSYTLDISTLHPCNGVFLSSDGKRIYTQQQYPNYIRQINLGTANELSTYWWDCLGAFSSYYDTHAAGLFIRERLGDSELDVYIPGNENNRVYHFITHETSLG